MKPLEPCEHTADDCLAWAAVNLRSGPRLASARYTFSLMQDRRDAQLMLGAQLQPTCVVHWRTGLDHLILLRGAPRGERLEWLE